MAAITITADDVAVLYPRFAEIYDFVAAAAITAGQAVYLTSAGTVNLADANGSGTLQLLGVALNGAGAGQAVSVLKRGFVAGYTVSGMAYDDVAYLSNTAGGLDTAAGGSTIIVGRVKATSDSSYTKVLYVEVPWITVWS